MEWLIATAVALIGYGAYRAMHGKKILPSLPRLPIGKQDQHLTLADQVAQGGPAKGAAMDLYGYLKVHGPDGMPAFTQLVVAFQTAANQDPNSVTLHGPLPTNGIFDMNTSAALTIYTHDPIPPATPPAPKPPPTQAEIMNMAVPGAAATSAFNLETYLLAHGNDKSQALTIFVTQFQIDVNTDPKFPGPKWALGPATAQVKKPLAVTGQYDAPTAAALRVGYPDLANYLR